MGAPTSPTSITNELVVPVDGTAMSNRVGPVVPAGMVNVTVALPISSNAGVKARSTDAVPSCAAAERHLDRAGRRSRSG